MEQNMGVTNIADRTPGIAEQTGKDKVLIQRCPRPGRIQDPQSPEMMCVEGGVIIPPVLRRSDSGCRSGEGFGVVAKPE